MSLFADIVSKIFSPQTSNASNAAMPVDASTGVPSSIAAPKMGGPGMNSEPAPPESVDVSQVLTEMAKLRHENLNWRTSIVDLLKVLEMDSSLAARQQLAKELEFTGDVHDSAAMNTWLQSQVMRKLSENGGHVPRELLH